MKKRVFIFLKIFGLLFVVFILIGFIYLNMATYEPMNEAVDVLSNEQVTQHDNYYIVEPIGTVKANLVYYQGGLVDTESYLPFALLLSEQGIRVYLPSMPLNLAILNQDIYQSIQDEHPSDLPWLLAGHSLGGASASLFLRDHSIDLDGLIFLASYPASNADLSNADYEVLSITTSKDGILDQNTYIETKSLLPSDATYHEIIGGNHAYYGHYGLQKGDLEATISRTTQQSLIVDEIITFINQQVLGGE